MKKLLNKPFRTFLTYTFIILACSIPVYYAIVDFIWLRELDEHNRILAAKIKTNITKVAVTDSALHQAIRVWNQVLPETKITETSEMKADSTYTLYRRNEYLRSKGSDRFQGLVTTFSVNGKLLSLTVENNVEESNETIAAITAVAIVFFIALFAGIIYINKKISKKLWQPFYDSLDRIRAYDLQSQKKISFEKNDTVEFTQLNENIERLVDSNLKVYTSQKEFAENASHELQTPLAVIKSKLDLLLQTPSVTAAQSVLIEEANNALARVSRINKNLLMLSRLENQQFGDTEKVDISQALHEGCVLFEEFFRDKKIDLSVQIDPGVTQQANKMLTEIVINNLLLNTVRHTPANGNVQVELTAQHLYVSNTGTTVLVADQLFKRFQSAAKHTPGSGLGLSIVQQICLRYNWEISYHFSAGKHRFEVSFNNA